MLNFITNYFDQTKKIIDQIDPVDVEKMLKLLIKIRENNGRLFFLGVGGGAVNATHAVNDCRKIAGIESYTTTDNFAFISYSWCWSSYDSEDSTALFKSKRFTSGSLSFKFS